MFIRISEETHDEPLRSAQTLCKSCEKHASIRLVERVRTVTAYWVFKSTERNHFLICDSCQGQFRVKPHNDGDLEYADIHTLLQMSGNRHVPFFAYAILFFDVICLPLPVLNLIMVWAAWSNHEWYTPFMMKVWRFTLWAAPAVTVALFVAMAFEKPYQP